MDYGSGPIALGARGSIRLQRVLEPSEDPCPEFGCDDILCQLKAPEVPSTCLSGGGTPEEGDTKASPRKDLP